MNMDVNDLRITVTVISLLLFLALMVHTYSRKRTAEHTQAERLPFLGEDEPKNPTRGEKL
jgi:cytochrome c oxidase cbb3-type subunit 4